MQDTIQYFCWDFNKSDHEKEIKVIEENLLLKRIVRGVTLKPAM